MVSLYVFVLFSTYLNSLASLSSPARAIFQEIFQDYEKNIRPVMNDSQSTVVTFRIRYIYIRTVNSAEESINLEFDYEMTWTDEFLSWHPSDFGDPVASLAVLQNLIWQPDITLDGLLSTSPLIPYDKLRARIDYDGRVSVSDPQVLTMSCVMKIDLFPFDVQTCTMGFGSWVYDSSEVKLQASNLSAADLGKVVGNKDWTVVSFESVHTDFVDAVGSYSALYFTLILKRNPAYYISVIIIPTFITTTLCLLGTFAPSSDVHREEKAELGLTTLLSLAIILSMVAEDMPKSTTLPLLGYFVMIELLICSTATLISIIMTFFHQRIVNGGIPPPKLCRRSRSNGQKRVHASKCIVSYNARPKRAQAYGKMNNSTSCTPSAA
uniref:Neurotransmitter-gated ion-channel ligand-binding domain-containing protein n=1 Tax=Plectus sambesii TaxID=2011161 RepID=A0A914VGY1_9BILA